jgi:hypothetical protein
MDMDLTRAGATNQGFGDEDGDKGISRYGRRNLRYHGSVLSNHQASTWNGVRKVFAQ